MRIVLIGSGNLATNLGKALARVGQQVVQVYSYTQSHAQELADSLNNLYSEEVVTATNDLQQVVADADVYVFSVKDSALESLIPQVGARATKGLFLHTAGSIPMDIFKEHVKKYGVLYPMQTFSKAREVDFFQIPVFVEGCNVQVESTIAELAKSVSNKVSLADSEQRKYLHLSAVFACNFVNHCYAISSRLLTEHGLSFEAMYPLIRETESKAHEMLPEYAQTGPAVRFDENVMNRHLQLLGEHPQWQELYEKMSQSIHQLSKTL